MDHLSEPSAPAAGENVINECYYQVHDIRCILSFDGIAQIPALSHAGEGAIAIGRIGVMVQMK